MADKIKHRGPDQTIYKNYGNSRVFFAFHRLKIVDLSENAMQPNELNEFKSICNGEIYNYISLKKQFKFITKSNCDCDVLCHLIKEIGIYKTCELLDGVFSFIVYDEIKNQIFVGRDPFGVRSLYYGYNENNDFIIASEMKSLPKSFKVKPFPPGSYGIISMKNNTWNLDKITRYYNYSYPKQLLTNESHITLKIRELMDNAITKRMMSNRPIGCLLSGGLDSSIVAAILSQKFKTSDQKLKTFSIGLPGSEDLKYAEIMAKHIGSDHTSVEISEDDMLNAIERDIYQIESYDTTTIRASTPMFLLCQYIKKNTDITVIFSGEGSDEASGSYMYFHNAPSPQEFGKETLRLLSELHRFDVLRCDKSSAGTGLEIRVPFLDKEFINFYMGLDPRLKMCNGNIEKYLLRKAFEDLMPKDIAWRQKEGMSDGVSSMKKSWAEIIQEKVEPLITQPMSEALSKLDNPPLLKESMYYRQVFRQQFGERDDILPHYWMPKWCGDLKDPSARILSVYNKDKDSSETEEGDTNNNDITYEEVEMDETVLEEIKQEIDSKLKFDDTNNNDNDDKDDDDENIDNLNDSQQNGSSD